MTFGQIRSTPLRLTAILLTIFTVAGAFCLAVAYNVTRAEIDATLDADLRQTFSTFRAVDETHELTELLSKAVANTDPEVRIVHYRPDQGPVISNVGRFPPVKGLTIVAQNTIVGDARGLAESYLARSARVGAGQLIIAQSRNQIVEMREVFVGVMLIGLLPALLIAGGAGWSVARTARRRIDAIEAALRDLTGGTLSARVSGIDGRADDLSGIGHSVNAMATAQEALVASMHQISSDIAHDLKTPIQRVAVVLDRMRTRTVLSDGQEDMLKTALDETDRIVRTFQALLQLAQIEGGAVRDRLAPVNLADVARDVVDFLEVEAEGHGVALTVEAPEDAQIRGDRHLLSQILGNLITNAFVHAATHGPVTVAVKQCTNGTVLTVSDRGPGIPQEERLKVLRRLYRLERSRTTDGNGLGLSLVSAIADLHGATLTLEDNAPGLTVRLVFPGLVLPGGARS